MTPEEKKALIEGLIEKHKLPDDLIASAKGSRILDMMSELITVLSPEWVSVKAKIKDLEEERARWINKQHTYKWLRNEKENGSEEYGRLQAKEADCESKIELLKSLLATPPKQ